MPRLALALCVYLAAAPKGTAGPCDGTATVPALVTVDVFEESFVVRMIDQSRLNQAIAICKGQSPDRIVNGFVTTGNRGYNRDPQNGTVWSWHLREVTVELAELTIELCDGRPSHVEADIGEWLANSPTFCPWYSHVSAIAPDTSSDGDFNLDSQVDAEDANQLMACISESKTPCFDLAGGCCAADMNGDHSIDCADWEFFGEAWTSSEDPPFFALCPSHIPTVSPTGMIVLTIALLGGGAIVMLRKQSGRASLGQIE